MQCARGFAIVRTWAANINELTELKMIFCVKTLENGVSLGVMGFDCAIAAMEHIANMEAMGRTVEHYTVAKVD